MATTQLTKDNFVNTVSKNEIVLVDYWADWCGPCKMFGPVYEEVSERYPNITFGKVDTEAEQELAASFNIRSIPTLMAFKDNVMVFSQPGFLPAEALEELVQKIQELDMEQVKKEIEKEKARTTN